ncbi:hypothetical protein [Pseudonocardia sp. HH130630-07]|uniref:hypothetical protein n=1 Tax=Pseudonocardia sp. HH130630-07 TaxID=1690815 RepID=UPI0012E9A44A|nr:hypothetical protein [Pseudonocardia sp. HH130630-07]
MNALWPPDPGTPLPASRRCPARSASRTGRAAPLAQRQAALVAALVAGGPDPAGFPEPLLAATRSALLRTRAARTAVQWPLLADDAGPGWAALYARRFAGVPPYGADREGWDLARELAAAGLLGAGAVRELDEREIAFRYDGRSAPVPRSAFARRLLRWRDVVRRGPIGS